MSDLVDSDVWNAVRNGVCSSFFVRKGKLINVSLCFPHYEEPEEGFLTFIGLFMKTVVI